MKEVQIPLWSIITGNSREPNSCSYGSNSSMVDNNADRCSKRSAAAPVQIPLWSIITMIRLGWHCTRTGVQIPLWSIITQNAWVSGWRGGGSNSSMVDNNQKYAGRLLATTEVQIPLWSIITGTSTLSDAVQASSNSSMVDNNYAVASTIISKLPVQIPLWSIITTSFPC